jgi:uncharacterized protein YdaU (DUF1376 family)
MEIVMHYFQFNIGDYASHTRHLSLYEDLAYRRLLDAYYLREKPLPKEVELVARLISMNDRLTDVERVLNEFFEATKVGWINKRADEEIFRFHKKLATASKAGKASVESKRQRSLNDTSTDVQPTNNHKPLTNNQEPVLKPREPKGSLSGSIPTCPHQQLVDLFHKTLPELPEVRIWNSTRESLLKARWRETSKRLEWVSVQDGLEYFEKLFTWIRQSKFLMGQVNPKPGQRAFECELEWILRPQNWAKLIEGKYHAV